MIITFWFAITLTIIFVGLASLGRLVTDTFLGDTLLPLIVLAAVLALAVWSVFVGWFALHSIGAVSAVRITPLERNL
ncbi:hypothetical protein [Nocardia miyunensis]|uniref:hypothetical protein n=1 Tax=Nocardia miyunensis TaxID=282684 RepID=UPI00082A0610|nr:hypothetical protein [Nocardia miyunensis]